MDFQPDIFNQTFSTRHFQPDIFNMTFSEEAPANVDAKAMEGITFISFDISK